MKTFQYTVTDPEGIHARPAGILVKTAAKYESGITISAGEETADLKRIFAVMGLGVEKGQTVTITAEGVDEEAAVREIQNFMEENL